MLDEILTEFDDKYLGGDVKGFSKAISASNASWIYRLIIDYMNYNISNIEKGDLDSLKNILEIDICSLENALIDSSNGEYLYKYRKDIIDIVKKLENILKKNNIFNEDINNLIEFLKKDDLTDDIINTHNLKYIYKYARDIKGANVSKLEKEIIRCRNPKYIYMFAKDVKDADVARLMDAIVDIGDPKYMYLFAKNIDIDTNLLENAIIESENPKYIYLFAKDVVGARIKYLRNAIIDIGDLEYILEFAKNIDCDIERFEIDAIASGDARYIYEIAKIKKHGTKDLEKAIKQTGNPKYMYLFARDIKGSSMETCIVRCNNAKYMYLYAKNIKGADIIYIGRMILRTNDIKWIVKFFSEIANADIESAIIQLKTYNKDLDPKYINYLSKINGERKKVGYQKREDERISKDIDRSIKMALRSNNPKLILNTAIKYEKNLYRLGEAILKTGDIKRIYEYAVNVHVFDRLNFTDKIIESGNPEYIYKFARDVSGVNKNRLAFALIRLGNLEYIYKFARDVSGVGKKDLALAVIKSGNVKYISMFSKYVHDVDILSILNTPSPNPNFKGMEELLATPYDLYEILISAAYNDFDLKELSANLNLPYIKIKTIVEYLKIKCKLITYENSHKCQYCISPSIRFYSSKVMPICKENIPDLGRKYDDVYKVIKYFKDDDIDDLYVSNMIEKYYLEDEQEFLDSPKVKSIKNNH